MEVDKTICEHQGWVFEGTCVFPQSRGECSIQQHKIQFLGESYFGGLPWLATPAPIHGLQGWCKLSPSPALSTKCPGPIEGAALVWVSERQLQNSGVTQCKRQEHKIQGTSLSSSI